MLAGGAAAVLLASAPLYVEHKTDVDNRNACYIDAFVVRSAANCVLAQNVDRGTINSGGGGGVRGGHWRGLSIYRLTTSGGSLCSLIARALCLLVEQRKTADHNI